MSAQAYFGSLELELELEGAGDGGSCLHHFEIEPYQVLDSLSLDIYFHP